MSLTPSLPDVRNLAQVGEPFVLKWSSVPNDFSDQVSATQLRVLMIIRGSDGIAVSELARALDALPSSMTRLCDRLVAAGLIERLRDPTNHRFKMVSLSPAGRRLLEGLDVFRMQAVDAVLNEMSDEDRIHLQRGLTAFAEMRQVP